MTRFGNKTGTDADRARFKSKVREIPGGHWIWLLAYQAFQLDGDPLTCKAASHVLFTGPVPKDHVVRANCPEPGCVAPGHLISRRVTDRALAQRKLRARGGPREL